MNGANYYTYKKGNVRFFALNSNYMDPKQTAWLETQLRERRQRGLEDLLFPSPAVFLGQVSRT